ncbi:MAG: pyruvate kinase [Cellvibrionaceae bacterium]
MAENLANNISPEVNTLINTSTKIIATLGPGSREPEMLANLHSVGVNVFRLNFSHGSHEHHQETIERIRRLEEDLDEPITIMADLQGPKLRVGEIAENTYLELGQTFELHLDDVPGDNKRAQLPHKNIFDVVEIGHRLLVDDGKVMLKVTKATNDVIYTEVLVAGSISSNKGVNVPDAMIPIKSLTEKDKKDLIFALSQNINIFALSFVQSASDVEYLREVANQPIKIVSKLEKPAALQDLENIVQQSDAVMVARGDLGVELSPSAVPVAQRRIIRECRQQGKPVIVATQMLDSMTNLPTPTRAEASDVANAVYSGVDAVMLSGETAVGKYPIETVHMMKEIISQAENDVDTPLIETATSQKMLSNKHQKISQSISRAVKELAQSLNCHSIASFTTSGSTSISIARQRPSSQLIALTASPDTARFLSFVWGTKSVVTRDASNFDDMVSIVCSTLLNKGYSKTEELVVITAGVPFGQPGTTNMLRVEQL